MVTLKLKLFGVLASTDVVSTVTIFTEMAFAFDLDTTAAAYGWVFLQSVFI